MASGGDRDDAQGSEDVNDFLKRIRELGDRQESEDAERARKLEEEIMQSRKERQARRAERARSLSPTKDSPNQTSPVLGAMIASTKIGPPATLTINLDRPTSFETRQDHQSDALDKLIGSSPPDRSQPTTQTQRDTPSEILPKPSLPEIGLSRTPTLSWQQRPGSGIRGPRPLSMVETRKAPVPKPRESPELPSEDTASSRDQIAASLAQKDPAWFRQTADRGLQSAAYRKNQDDAPDTSHAYGGRMQLPGMSFDPEKRSTTPLSNRTSPLMPSSTESRNVLAVSASPQIAGSPITQSFATREETMRLSSAMSSQFADERLSRSNTVTGEARMASPDRSNRSPSPNKGLGSFVQSAMLKRENSVSKRWSVQSGSGLQQGGSVLGNRPTGLGLGSERPHTPSSIERTSPNASRSGSPIRNSTSVEDESNMRLSQRVASPVRGASTLQIDTQAMRRSNTAKSRTSSPSPPSTPTKTMDQKRWSPTKASWLESAINKNPESPTPKPAPSEQPQWMIDRERAKAQSREPSPDRAKFAEISTGGLMRAPDMGRAIKQSKSGTGPDLLGLSMNRPTSSEKPPVRPKPKEAAVLDSTEVIRSTSTKPADVPKPCGVASSSIESRMKPATPPKAEVLNLRSSLRTRPAVAPKPEQEPEFKNMLGKLKATKTQNYVAPDVLKSNILGGKAALAVTGGPKKTDRKDEFKESILQKKSSMKAKADEEQRRPGVFVKEKMEAALPPPEAITRSKTILNKPKPSHLISTPAADFTTSNSMQRTESPSNTSSKIANRFNPNLANLLAKGPPSTFRSESTPTTVSTARVVEVKHSTDAELTHLTKARARGPKRRLPTKQESAKEAEKVTPSPIAQEMDGNSDTTSSILTDIVNNRTERQALPKPTKLTSLPLRMRPADVEQENTKDEPIANNATPLSKSAVTQPAVSKETKAESKQKDAPKVSVKGAAASWSSPEVARAGPRPPVKLPTLADENKAMEDAGLRSPPMRKTAAPLPSPKPRDMAFKSPLTSPTSPKKVLPPPISPKPVSVRENPTSPTSVLLAQPSSPVPKANEAGRLFADHFIGIFPLNKATRVDFDVQKLLTPAPSVARTKTMKKQVWQLTKDGKMTSFPPERDYIFFENSMYLVSHIFDDASGRRSTEVYFWGGDAVSSAAAEDALLFARHFAKETNGTLIPVNQGNESPSFFQALGGVMITRRLPQAKIFLLCGRRHLGHITFDEVDCTPAALCSGFPYLLGTEKTMFIWKGRGPSVEELGCARLVAMDVGLTSDIVEVDEDEETPAFLAALGGNSKLLGSAGHWKLKQDAPDYSIRLFKIENAGISEITAFRQQDMLDAREGVVMVDGWFEVYIVLTASSKHNYNAFLTSLSFVQEYTVLASSLQKRPFVPVVTIVVLSDGGAAPRDLKRLFRTWSDIGGQKGGLKVASLSAAVAAVGRV